MTKQRKAQSQLVQFILQILKVEDDHFTLPANAGEGMKLALNGLFANPKLDAKAEIEALLKLGWLFETQHKSFEVSDQIIDFLAADPRVLAVLGISAGSKVRELRKRFARLGGEAPVAAAPVFGEEAPQGTLKISSFMTPGREKPRQRAGQKSEPKPKGGVKSKAKAKAKPAASRRPVRFR